MYRGTELSQLIGSYVYGDFGSGRIWALQYEGVDDPINTEVLNTDLNIASFGTHEENELYICAFDRKTHKLTVSPMRAPRAKCT